MAFKFLLSEPWSTMQKFFAEQLTMQQQFLLLFECYQLENETVKTYFCMFLSQVCFWRNIEEIKLSGVFVESNIPPSRKVQTILDKCV